jgi:APA family basic amino acid/polyamine antiporter
MAKSGEVFLDRRITLTMLWLYGLGTILGAGIYVLVGEVAGKAGMQAPWAFLVAATIASFSAFSYAEFSSRLPLSAGEAAYVSKAFSKSWLAVIVGLSVTFTGIVAAATILHGFLGYLEVFVRVNQQIGILFLVCILGGLAAWGIGQSVLVASLITLLEIFGLCFVIFCGAGHLAEIPSQWHALRPSLAGPSLYGVITAAYIAFFAFLGFEDMVNEAEEVIAPQRNVPLGIVLALVTGTLLYMLVALVAVLAVEPSRLQASAAPLAMVVEQNGYPPQIITVISLFAVINGALIQIVMASRVMYGMAKQALLPQVLATVYPKTKTPLMATAVVSILILTFAWWLPILKLAEVTTAFALFNFTLVNMALLKEKLAHPIPRAPFHVPIWVPLLGALLSTSMAVFYFF